jgi:hypothetical protein
MDVKSYPPASHFERRSDPEPVDDRPMSQPVPIMGVGKVALSTLLALGTVLVGVWTALVAYAAPTYGFAVDSAPAWQQTSHRVVLHMVPGAVATVAGLVLLLTVPGLRRGRRRVLGALAALMAIVVGIELVLGRSALAAFSGSQLVEAVQGSPSTVFLLRLGSEWGPGLLLVAFGAWCLGLQAMGKVRVGATRP